MQQYKQHKQYYCYSLVTWSAAELLGKVDMVFVYSLLAEDACDTGNSLPKELWFTALHFRSLGLEGQPHIAQAFWNSQQLEAIYSPGPANGKKKERLLLEGPEMSNVLSEEEAANASPEQLVVAALQVKARAVMHFFMCVREMRDDWNEEDRRAYVLVEMHRVDIPCLSMTAGKAPMTCCTTLTAARSVRSTQRMTQLCTFWNEVPGEPAVGLLPLKHLWGLGL